MNGHDMLDTVAAYVLGALSPEEARDFRKHMNECDICAAEYRKLKPLSDVMALAASPSADVSPLVKQRLMREVKMQRRQPSPFLAYALAAACLLVAILASVGYAYRSAEIAQTQKQLDRTNAVLTDVLSPNARRYTVPGGQIVHSGSKIYVVMHTLADPPRGTVYQMWTLASGAKTVAPSITFVPEHGATLVRLPIDASRIAAVAMSVEPPGGSKQPTTKPRFLVKL